MHVTVIYKAPVPGTVKTRLVPPLTHETAAQVATACLLDTFAAVEAALTDGVRPVALIDGDAFAPPGWDVRRQRGDGLGERLANGFAELGPGVIIGMDTPSVGRWLGAALTAVREGDDAIGMTVDGGYWGIGLAAPDGSEFDGVPMSAPTTGAVQLARLHAMGRTVRVLPTVTDLDTIDDLGPVATALPGSHIAALHARITSERTG